MEKAYGSLSSYRVPSESLSVESSCLIRDDVLAGVSA